MPVGLSNAISVGAWLIGVTVVLMGAVVVLMAVLPPLIVESTYNFVPLFEYGMPAELSIARTPKLGGGPTKFVAGKNRMLALALSANALDGFTAPILNQFAPASVEYCHVPSVLALLLQTATPDRVAPASGSVTKPVNKLAIVAPGGLALF